MNLACDWLWCRRQFSGPITISLKTPLFRSCWSWQYAGRFLQINLVQVRTWSCQRPLRWRWSVCKSNPPRTIRLFLHQTPVTHVSDLFLYVNFWKEEFHMYTQYYNRPSLFNQTESQKLRWEEKDKKFPNPCIWADCSHGRAGPWCPSTAVVLPFNELGSPSVLTLKIKR